MTGDRDPDAAFACPIASSAACRFPQPYHVLSHLFRRYLGNTKKTSIPLHSLLSRDRTVDIGQHQGRGCFFDCNVCPRTEEVQLAAGWLQ